MSFSHYKRKFFLYHNLKEKILSFMCGPNYLLSNEVWCAAQNIEVTCKPVTKHSKVVKVTRLPC